MDQYRIGAELDLAPLIAQLQAIDPMLGIALSAASLRAILRLMRGMDATHDPERPIIAAEEWLGCPCEEHRKALWWSAAGSSLAVLWTLGGILPDGIENLGTPAVRDDVVTIVETVMEALVDSGEVTSLPAAWELVRAFARPVLVARGLQNRMSYSNPV